MTYSQARTIDMMEADARETGATVTYTDDPSPTGPIVTVRETFTDGAMIWSIDRYGDATFIDVEARGADR